MEVQIGRISAEHFSGPIDRTRTEATAIHCGFIGFFSFLLSVHFLIQNGDNRAASILPALIIG
jgi:hypothetical protein